MVGIVHRIGIRAPAPDVFRALATIDGLAGWWTRSTSGDARVGGSIMFRFLSVGGDEKGHFDMLVTELTPARKVAWRVQDGPPEWVGTEVSFALSEQGGMTVVLFAHRGWREEVEFTAHCSTKWAVFLLSLRDLVERGAGQPSPDDLKIDDWN